MRRATWLCGHRDKLIEYESFTDIRYSGYTAAAVLYSVQMDPFTVPQPSSGRVDRDLLGYLPQTRALPLQPHPHNSASQTEAEEAIGCLED